MLEGTHKSIRRWCTDKEVSEAAVQAREVQVQNDQEGQQIRDREEAGEGLSNDEEVHHLWASAGEEKKIVEVRRCLRGKPC